MPQDYDGDGKADRAVFRPGSGTANTWYIYYSSQGGSVATGFNMSNPAAVPLP